MPRIIRFLYENVSCWWQEKLQTFWPLTSLHSWTRVNFAGSRQAVKTANVPVAHNFCSNKSTVSQALPVAMSQVGHQWVKTDVRWIWSLQSVLNVTPNLSDFESRYVLKTQPAHTLIFPLCSKNTFSLIFQSTRLRSSVNESLTNVL